MSLAVSVLCKVVCVSPAPLSEVNTTIVLSWCPVCRSLARIRPTLSSSAVTMPRRTASFEYSPYTHRRGGIFSYQINNLIWS